MDDHDADTTAHRIASTLDGSPYSVPSDEAGTKKVNWLAKRSDSMRARSERVTAEFARQHREIRELIGTSQRTRAVFESNALESAGLPLDETAKVLKHAPRDLQSLGSHIAERVMQGDKHLVEVLGLHGANQFASVIAREYANPGAPGLSEADVRSLHQYAASGETFAGSYRTREVRISGSDHTPPSVLEVPIHMRQMVDWVNSTSELFPPLAAAVAHTWTTIVHPFEDGNGRVARLMANLVLLRHRWPPLIVESSDRIQYLDALGHSDSGGDILPLFELFTKSIERELRDLERPDLAIDLYNKQLRRDPDRRHRVWWNHLNEFLEALRRVLTPAGFVMDRLAAPPVTTLTRLESRDPSGNTWLAKIRRPSGPDFLLWLGYMSDDMVDYHPEAIHPPSIFISERDLSPDAIKPYISPFKWTRLRVREISIMSIVRDAPVLVRDRYGASFETVNAAARELAQELNLDG